MRRRRRGPLNSIAQPDCARAACAGDGDGDDDGASGVLGTPSQPGVIHDDTLAEIWELRDMNQQRLKRQPSSRRLMERSIKDLGHVPPDLSDDAHKNRVHRDEFVLNFLTMIKKIDASDILDASDFYNSLCENNPNAAEHGLTLEEARHATERFNKLSIAQERHQEPQEYNIEAFQTKL